MDAELRARTRAPEGAADGALVLFHGRGTDEHDLWPLLDVFDPERRLLGVTPRGPLSLADAPELGAPGAHWYVVRRVGYPDSETFHSSYRSAAGWLDGLLAEHDIPPERAVVGGFSQGAVMSYALGLGRRRPAPAGILAMSGFIPSVEGFDLDLADRSGLPVAITHGELDPLIPVDFGRDARDRLEGAGADVLYRESAMAHTIDPRVIPELSGWLNRTLRPASRGNEAERPAS